MDDLEPLLRNKWLIKSLVCYI